MVLLNGFLVMEHHRVKKKRSMKFVCSVAMGEFHVANNNNNNNNNKIIIVIKIKIMVKEK